jgi:uncharacterized protein involved in tolerance to divalent cations
LHLEKRIKDLHSYTVPEIVAIAIEAGHKPYLDWLEKASAMTRIEKGPEGAQALGK